MIRQHPITTSISILLSARSPFAVFGFVVSAVVDALKSVRVAGLVPHVFKKVFKGQPAFAYANSSCTVPFVRVAIWVITSLKQSKPCAKFRGQLAALGVAVDNLSGHQKNLLNRFDCCLEPRGTSLPHRLSFYKNRNKSKPNI
jgi:hypothetical protein